MKFEWKYIVVIISIVAGVAVAGFAVSTYTGQSQTLAAESGSELYTCGMHPEVIQEGPGLCPICNMNLVPLGSVDEASEAVHGGSGAGVTIDPWTVQNIGVRYADVQRGPLEKTITVPAHVDYDEDNYMVLSTRADGWIEKLYVRSPGESVSVGDPLFDFYSPKLYSAQREWLIALSTGDSGLASASRQRLVLLGVSDEQIDRIRVDGARQSLTIVSPMDGIVVSMGGGGGMSGGMSGGSGMSGMGGMGDMPSGGGGINSGAGTSSSGGEILREGDYVGSGAAVFAIADLSTVWVYAHVYEDEIAYISEGMSAELELDYLPGEIRTGQVEIIYPFLDRVTRDIKIRMSFSNEDGRLLPGMFGRVSVTNRISDDALIIPAEAVVHSGDRQVVFVAEGEGRFEPREILAGPGDGNGNVQVVSGLEEGQSVVTSAQFLLDSESSLREALSRMLETRMGHNHEAEVEASDSEQEWPGLAPDDPDAKYRCPMPEDRYYAAEDGECPICGMFLEPIEDED